MRSDSGDDILVFQNGKLVDVVETQPGTNKLGHSRTIPATVMVATKYRMDRSDVLANLQGGPPVVVEGLRGSFELQYRHVAERLHELGVKPFPMEVHLLEEGEADLTFKQQLKKMIEDADRRFREEQKKARKGTRSRGRLFTDEQVLEMFRRKRSGEGAASISKDYGVAPQSIHAILKRKTYKHVDLSSLNTEQNPKP